MGGREQYCSIFWIRISLKTEKDEPTLGLLVCKSKDDIKAQYALESSSQPLGVSAYELSKLIPENFKGSLPSIDEIESELQKDVKKVI